jgi:hypothetical protein
MTILLFIKFVVKTDTESLSQYDRINVVPTSLSGIRVRKKNLYHMIFTSDKAKYIINEFLIEMVNATVI